MWECLCRCGQKSLAVSRNLRKGIVKSCGCGIGESTARRFEKRIRKGARFGKLKVLYKDKQDRHGNWLYICACDCGKAHTTKGSNLRSGKTSSCGCGQLEAVTIHGKSQTPAYYRVHSLLRRRRKGRRKNWFTIGDLEELLVQQQGRCYYCNKKLPDNYHADHKTPLSRGGKNTKSNIALACPKCNLRKHVLTEKEFLRKLEGL